MAASVALDLMRQRETADVHKTHIQRLQLSKDAQIAALEDRVRPRECVSESERQGMREREAVNERERGSE